MAHPELPPITSTQLRKRVFTHVSVFRLPANDLEQIENTDNDRLSFMGRAALDYVLSASTPVLDVDAQLASLARSYDLVRHLHTGWRDQDPAPRATEAQLMEAYVGALVVENEQAGMKFARELVVAMGGQITSVAPERPVHEDQEPTRLLGPEATGQLHNLAARHHITLSWDDRVQGPQHAQQWESDLSLHDTKTNQSWPCIAQGLGRSRKVARANAATKALLLWNDITS